MSDSTYPYNVSVIVPVYNVAPYLRKSVFSLLGQTLNYVQYIFVDDCSTDGSFETLQKVIQEYGVHANTVQIVRHESNKGVAAARNTGLSLAQGKYVAAMDPDDWIDSDMLERMYTTADAGRMDIVWCDYVNDYGSHGVYVSQETMERPHSCIEDMLTGKLLGSMCNKLISYTLFTKNAITFPEGLNMCEDLRVCVQLFYYAQRVGHIKQGFYHYVKCRTDSISTISGNAPVVNYEWINNVSEIAKFVSEKKLDHLLGVIAVFKQFPKQNLLVRGDSLAAFKMWKDIFPESNAYIWKGNLPLHYKIIATAIDRELWCVPNIWLMIKRLKARLIR